MEALNFVYTIHDTYFHHLITLNYSHLNFPVAQKKVGDSCSKSTRKLLVLS